MLIINMLNEIIIIIIIINYIYSGYPRHRSDFQWGPAHLSYMNSDFMHALFTSKIMKIINMLMVHGSLFNVIDEDNTTNTNNNV